MTFESLPHHAFGTRPCTMYRRSPVQTTMSCGALPTHVSQNRGRRMSLGRQRMPSGFKSISSRVRAFKTFFTALLLPQFTTYKANFRRKCGIMQYLWFFVLIASILTAFVMSMLSSGNDISSPPKYFQPHHHTHEAYVHKVRPEKLPVGRHFHIKHRLRHASDVSVSATRQGPVIRPHHAKFTSELHRAIKRPTHAVNYHGKGMRLYRQRRRLAAMAQKKRQEQLAKGLSPHPSVPHQSNPGRNHGTTLDSAKVYLNGDLKKADKATSHQRGESKRMHHQFSRRAPRHHGHAKHLRHHSSRNVSHHNRHGKLFRPATKVNPRGHLNVQKGTLQSIPQTRWYAHKATMAFKPSQVKKTDMRLISLKDACYCSKRNKFLLPPREFPKETRFPNFLYRYKIADSVPWDKPASLLAFRDQEVVRVPGRTIMWRGRSLSEYHTHLAGSLLTVRSLIDVLKKEKVSPIRFAAQSFTDHGQHDGRISALHDYYLGDIPSDMIIEIKSLKPKMICFDEVHAIGSEYENHALTREAYDHVKDLVERREKGRLRHHLVKSCKDKTANRRTVYIIDRQEVNGRSGSMANADAVKKALNEVLQALGLDKTVTTKVVRAPSLPCPEGDEGCGEVPCGEGQSKEDCERADSVMRDVIGYNDRTFLIAISGPGLSGLVHMPRGSHVVEIAPFGNYDRARERAAKDAGVMYKRVENYADKDVEANLRERFGDVASSPRACWADLECRKAREGFATVVNVPLLKLMVRDQLVRWKETCRVR